MMVHPLDHVDPATPLRHKILIVLAVAIIVGAFAFAIYKAVNRDRPSAQEVCSVHGGVNQITNPSFGTPEVLCQDGYVGRYWL